MHHVYGLTNKHTDTISLGTYVKLADSVYIVLIPANDEHIEI